MKQYVYLSIVALLLVLPVSIEQATEGLEPVEAITEITEIIEDTVEDPLGILPTETIVPTEVPSPGPIAPSPILPTQAPTQAPTRKPVPTATTEDNTSTPEPQPGPSPTEASESPESSRLAPSMARELNFVPLDESREPMVQSPRQQVERAIEAISDLPLWIKALMTLAGTSTAGLLYWAGRRDERRRLLRDIRQMED